MKPRIKICCISSADEARMAIDEVQPFGIDVCSGVRTDGKLDRQKLSDFFFNASG